MDVADEANLQRNALVENVLSQIAQLHGPAVHDRDVVDQARSVSDPMRPAILNRLPDRFLAIAFAGVNRNIKILPLNVVKGVNVLFGRITAFFSGKIEADNSTLTKIHSEFRHLERYIHVTHGADDQARSNSKILSPSLQSLQDGRDDLLVGQSFFSVKNWRKASLKVNHSIFAEILGLFIGDALQSLLGLHDRDGVAETLEVFGETSLVRALMKPFRQRPGIGCRPVPVSPVFGQLNHGLRLQHAIQVLVQKDFGKTLQ